MIAKKQYLAHLSKELGQIASSVILLNGLYLSALISKKFDAVQSVGIVSFVAIPIIFQFQKLAGFTLSFSIVVSLILAGIGSLTLFCESLDDEK